MENKQDLSSLNLPIIIPPKELWVGLANHLSFDDISAFTSSCRFFSILSKDKQLIDIKKEKRILCTAGENRTLLYVNNTVWLSDKHDDGLALFKPNKNEHTFIACAMALQQGEHVIQMETNSQSSFLLTNQNRLLVCQHNDKKNKNTYRALDVKLQDKEQISGIAVGGNYSLFFTNQGRLCLWRHEYDCKQFFINANNNQNSFVSVSIKGIIEVKVGYSHILCLTNENKLYVRGRNHLGQLGLGHDKAQDTFVECTIKLQQGEQIIRMAAVNNHSLLLTNQNRLLACGSNKRGQLGLGHVNNQDTFVACTIELEQGEQIIQIAISDDNSLLLTNQNRLLESGSQKTFVACSIELLQDERIIKIKAGANHFLLLTDQNRLFVRGLNNDGQLGVKDRNTLIQFTPIPSLLKLEKVWSIEGEPDNSNAYDHEDPAHASCILF